MTTPQEKPQQNANSWKPAIVWALIIAALTYALFSPALNYTFVTFDDDQYVYQNELVTNGFSLDNIKAAWTSFYASYWCPVLWMSYMADFAVHGMDPSGFHQTNILLHSLNGALVFLLLRLLIGGTVPALIGAAIFAWHPLRVESVAWITERKDVLSLFWGLLAMLAYCRYARKPQKSGMLVVFALLMLGLLSKPSLVVLPVLLLLLDYWPLGRGDKGFASLVTEKALLWIAAIGISIVTFIAQKSALISMNESSIFERILHVPATYIFYLWKSVWPSQLTILYPDIALSWVSIITTALAFIVVISALLTRPKQSPGLAVGCLWFLVALLPVSGLIRSGTVHLADRFTYLPSIGISIGIVWILANLSSKRRWPIFLVAIAAPIALATVTWNNLPRWKDSISLFQDSIQKAPHHAAFYNMGNLLLMLDKPNEAANHFAQSALLKPNRPEAHYNFGITMAKLGKHKEAIIAFHTTTQLRPTDPNAWLNLGNSFYLSKQAKEALNAYQKALELDPESAQLHNNVAWLLAMAEEDDIRDLDEALVHAQRAVELIPNRAEFHDTLAAVYGKTGEFESAIKESQTAIDLYQKAGLKKNAAETIQRQAAYKEERPL